MIDRCNSFDNQYGFFVLNGNTNPDADWAWETQGVAEPSLHQDSISYTLGREYWVMRNRYSRLFIH